mmetsp:Transcript_46259/g.72432  ORF Transcript_46259/g.72432 Transcript_46259/m.72432 type:complete len:135 (+) Transcript_46259:211-615(+)|eukprot:CAMPEP_0184326294 /NCGR_PEP_ID=MMETSP1049-20130417/142477_1 /TAXON_ID=77928 /ORGANISM="Proteomonas sulcata, Strain CCMP704" /LENGTH=134 /DNA_ID=CAMNT_0026648481 /DNA_START=205 /DNA_END=609 /DNA_ORIENTATION=+
MTDGKPEKKMVNPDLRKGDAQAQWSESDLNFFDTKGKMVGSQGQIIDLGTEGDKGQQQQNKSFKATTTTTEQREGKWMMEMMSTEYTMYKFQVSFGKTKWEIAKRYSDFDKIDNRVAPTQPLLMISQESCCPFF